MFGSFKYSVYKSAGLSNSHLQIPREELVIMNVPLSRPEQTENGVT